MTDLLNLRLSKELEATKNANGLRTLKLTDPKDPKIINLASNDYLNLSKHPKVIKASQHAAQQFGTSSGGSPVVASYFEIHKELEQTMSKWLGFTECLIWTSGFSANKSILETILKKDDLVLADRLCHSSSLSGIIESGARLIRYNHCDINHLETLLKKYSKVNQLIFVLTESLFSMDGDYPDLSAISKLKSRFPFLFVLDEAHALGWYGPTGNGLAAQFQITEHVDILIATLGKSLASQGAVSLFHNSKIKDTLINYSKDFIYSTYPAPSCIAAAKEAANLIKEELYKEQDLWHQEAFSLKAKLQQYFPEIVANESPILPIILKSNNAAMFAQEKLYKEGVLVGAIRPPSVPEGTSRLRLSLNKDIDSQYIANKIIKALQSNHELESITNLGL